MKKACMRVLFCLVTIAIGVGGWKVAFAEEVGYVISVEPSKFQRDTGVSYYDLRLRPNQEVDLAVNIANQSDEEATFDIHTNTAVTNSRGIIDYSQTAKEEIDYDSTLTVKFSDIAKAKQIKVTIPGHQQAKVPIHVKMPAEEFDGMVLGGIYVVKVTDNQDKVKEGFSNRYSFVKGVVITENDNEVKPKIVLNNVTTQVKDYRAEIISTLQNPSRLNISNLTIEAVIKDAKNKKVVAENRVENRGMAPNSNFNYSFDFKSKKLPVGEFIMEMKLADQSGNTWNLSKPFEIKEEEAEKVQLETDFGFKKEKQRNQLFLIIGSVVCLTIVAGSVVWGIRKKNRNHEKNYKRKSIYKKK